jgi:serine/threonine protein kinase
MIMASFPIHDPLRLQLAPPAPPVKTVSVRMKDLPGSVTLELSSDIPTSVADLITRFHEHAFAKSYATFASRSSLLAMRPRSANDSALHEVALTSLDDVRDAEVLVYKPCEELRALVETGCITPVLQRARAPQSSSPTMKRKGRSASVANSSERVHRYAPLLEKMHVSPRERELINDHLLSGDAQVVDAMEQFTMHRNPDTVRRALRGPTGKTAATSPVVSVDHLMDNLASLEMQSPAGMHLFDMQHQYAQPNPFVAAAVTSPVVTQPARPSMMLMMMDDHDMVGGATLPAETNPFLVSSSPVVSTPNKPPRSRTPKKAARPSLLFDDSALTENAPSVFLHSIKEKATPPAARMSLSLDDLDIGVFDELQPQLFSVATLLENVPVARDFHDHYDVGRVLGSGKYSVVKEATRRGTGERFAVKIIDKKQMLEVRFLKRELEIMFGLRHDGVVQLLALFETNDELFLVMELCSQELFEYVDRNGPLDEPTAQRLIARLVATVAYLHAECIVHRDIKPENILLRGTDVWDIKLTDFGIARKLEGANLMLTPHESLSEVANLHDLHDASSVVTRSRVVQNRQARAHTKCGTRDYVAPEVMGGKGYGTEADLWSVGVVTYVLLSGCAPVFLPTQDGTKKVFFGEDCWHDLSSEVKLFIESLLVRNPEERSTAVEALQHPWLQGVPL